MNQKLNFYQCIQLLSALAEKKIIQRDPENKNNILVYRSVGTEYPMELRFFPDDEKPKKKLDKLQQHENGRQILASYFLCMQPNNELSEYLKQNFEPYYE